MGCGSLEMETSSPMSLGEGGTYLGIIPRHRILCPFISQPTTTNADSRTYETANEMRIVIRAHQERLLTGASGVYMTVSRLREESTSPVAGQTQHSSCYFSHNLNLNPVIRMVEALSENTPRRPPYPTLERRRGRIAA